MPDGDMKLTTRAFMGTRWQIFAKIRLPHALPLIFGGMKISITLAVIGIVVAEFVAAQRGIGYAHLRHVDVVKDRPVIAFPVHNCGQGHHRKIANGNL